MTIKEEKYEFSFYYRDDNGAKGDFVLRSKYVYNSWDVRVGKLVKEDEAVVKSLKDIEEGTYKCKESVPYYSKSTTLDGDRYISAHIYNSSEFKIQLYKRETQYSTQYEPIGSLV